VFGYSDTDGDDLPSVELPGWDTETALAVQNSGMHRSALTHLAARISSP